MCRLGPERRSQARIEVLLGELVAGDLRLNPKRPCAPGVQLQRSDHGWHPSRLGQPTGILPVAEVLGVEILAGALRGLLLGQPETSALLPKISGEVHDGTFVCVSERFNPNFVGI